MPEEKVPFYEKYAKIIIIFIFIIPAAASFVEEDLGPFILGGFGVAGFLLLDKYFLHTSKLRKTKETPLGPSPIQEPGYVVERDTQTGLEKPRMVQTPLPPQPPPQFPQQPVQPRGEGR